MKTKEIEEIENELNIPKIPTMDLSSFIKIKNKNKKMKIGVLNDKIDGLTSYKKGDIVLFTPYTVEECYNKMLWAEMEQHIKLCTLEVPSDRYFKGESNIPTIKTMVCVPLHYIDYEILISAE